jgi:hypothetical protein
MKSKSKSTKVLIGVVMLIAIIYVVQRLTSTTITTENLRPFASFDTANVKQISIFFGKEISIAREFSDSARMKNGWVIVSPIHFPADQGEVNLFLSHIAGNPSAYVVADNLVDSSAYGIDSNAPIVKLYMNNGKQFYFRVGDVTPDFDGCYVVMDGGKKILNLASNIRTLVGQSLEAWRDKNIFPFRLKDVQVIDFSLSDTLYHFLHKDTAWQLNGNPVPSAEAERTIRSFVEMSAVGFMDTTVAKTTELFDYGITLFDGTRITGRVMRLPGTNSSSEQTLISSSANPVYGIYTSQVYIISSVLPDNLENALRELRRKTRS